MDIERKKEILKNAMIIERKAYVFYKKLADDATDASLKNLFEVLSDEEIKHFDTLKKQYLSLKNDNKFSPLVVSPKDKENPVSKVLTKEVLQKLSEVTFETAAIYGAYLLEKNSIDYYSNCLKEAEDSEEKALFEWLSIWEQGHLELLNSIDNDIKEEIWLNNKFWPF
jgi:rubrerythrin